MALDRTQRWLDVLGYTSHVDALHSANAAVPAHHGYASELRALLDPTGPIRATAVFDIHGMPTVCFIDPAGQPGGWVEGVRQRIWNQNLVSIVLVVDDHRLTAYSPLRLAATPEEITLAAASPEGPLAPADMQSGDIWSRRPDWFHANQRVDSLLLANLALVIDRMVKEQRMDRAASQLLLGQTLFVSYLEHRGVVGPVYRERHAVQPLLTLIESRDRDGLTRLFKELSGTFNGDFLAPDVSTRAGWARLGDGVLDLLERFLSRVDMQTGQGSFWNYDFRFIPVELLSGIYETFLSDKRRSQGAYYTPRHLANLVVDQAFDGIEDPTAETVYDGACGSGILLTTAFRRMLGYAQTRRGGDPLPLRERIALLTTRILGSDISEPACRVTAFSLYLSLLEDLVPADIAQLTEDPDVKLPPLLGRTVFFGAQGEFFSPDNPLAVAGRCSIFLSNPPWAEPSGSRGELPYENWLEQNGRVTARRQIAGAFAHRAITLISPTDRVVLILPISLLLAPTSRPFVRDWLRIARPDLVINFGDLRRQLFPDAKHGCAIVVARPREAAGRVPADELFDYWSPKVDVSLAFGRLALHSGDRHRVPTQHWWEDNLCLRILTWGSREDQMLIGRLQIDGCLQDAVRMHGWQLVKGFHHHDRGIAPMDPGPLRTMRFLDARMIPTDRPTLSASLLMAFPAEIDGVASHGSNEGRAFSGPRVLFPDGISGDLQLRAVFTGLDACFKHTVAALCGGPGDEDVLRFLTVYLRSGLASYLTLHTAFSPANERERITLKEVDGFPFTHPCEHAKPDHAWTIVRKVAAATRDFEAQDGLMTPPWRQEHHEELIADYFELTAVERALVRETVQWALPSRQVVDTAKLLTPWQSTPSNATVGAYVDTLRQRLEHWRDTLGGSGHFHINAHLGMRASHRGVGIVEIRLVTGAGASESQVTVSGLEAVHAVISKLVAADLLPMRVSENLFLSADFLVIENTTAYLVKPLANRLWRASQGVRDARRLVEEVSRERAR